jgi:tyrosine-protein phosphatase non-receptor type 4
MENILQTTYYTTKKKPFRNIFQIIFFSFTDPSRLHEEYTRYLMYLQVKRDLCEGRLSAPVSTISLLTSYAVQSTLGDYDPDTCNKNYLLPFRDLRRQSMAAAGAAGNASNLSPEEMDRRIAELHKLHKHQSPAEAEFNFLEHAKRLEMYGISLHPGKDSNGRDIQLGVTCIGLVVFQNQVKINTFSWSKIVKISFKRKQFFIQLRKELTESYDTLLGFNLASYR